VGTLKAKKRSKQKRKKLIRVSQGEKPLVVSKGKGGEEGKEPVRPRPPIGGSRERKRGRRGAVSPEKATWKDLRKSAFKEADREKKEMGGGEKKSMSKTSNRLHLET